MILDGEIVVVVVGGARGSHRRRHLLALRRRPSLGRRARRVDVRFTRADAHGEFAFECLELRQFHRLLLLATRLTRARTRRRRRRRRLLPTRARLRGGLRVVVSETIARGC